MRIRPHQITRLTSVIFAGALCVSLGCQQGEPYETQKPVVDDSTTTEITDSLKDAGENLSNAAEATADAAAEAADNARQSASDAADQLTPDEPIIDIRTPLGDVQVGEDPVTGDTNVDVDTPRADVEVGGNQ